MAAARMRRGQWLAFPTDWGYTLGSNMQAAMDGLTSSAISSYIKGPIILHAPDNSAAGAQLCLTDNQRNLFNVLVRRHWPGHLVILGKSKTSPTIIGVSVSPNFMVNRLIHQLNEPIATVQYCGLDSSGFNHIMTSHEARCQLQPIKSHIMMLSEVSDMYREATRPTIVHLDNDNNGIRLVQRGYVTETELCETVATVGGSVVSGGLSLPDAYMLMTNTLPYISPSKVVSRIAHLSKCLVVDFGGKVSWAREPVALRYVDLSPSASGDEAVANMMPTLHNLEGVTGARAILLPELIDSDRYHLHHDDTNEFIRLATSSRYVMVDDSMVVRII